MATQDRLPTGVGVIDEIALGAGSDKVDAVDDTIGAPDDDTTYLLSDGADSTNLWQSYTYTDFAISSSAIASVTVTARIKGITGTSNIPRVGIYVGGTRYESSNLAESTSYTDLSYTWTTNPATAAAWVESDVEGVGSNPLEEMAVRSRAGSGHQIRVTQIYITVDYTASGGSSPSASASPSISPSSSISPSLSASASSSISPSSSVSSSRSPSSSTSASVSPSSSRSPSVSASASVSPSVSDAGVALTSVALEAELSAPTWTDITGDTLASKGLSISYGIDGNGPLNRVASTGTMRWYLLNSAGNSGAQQGWYSPNHASSRSGWDYGTPVRIVFTYDGTDYYKFIGKLSDVNPTPGQYRAQDVACEAVDWIDEAASTIVRDITPQSDQRADQLITSILAAMPSAAQPVSTTFDTGASVFPIALHDIGEGAPALQMIAKVVQSEFGFFAVIGDTSAGGVARSRARSARANSSSSATLNETMNGLVVPSSLDGVYNLVNVKVHPSRESFSTLFSLPVEPSSVRPILAPSETRTFWITYQAPDNQGTLIGAKNGIAPEADVDYTMNTAPDGSSTDATDDFTVTVTYYASTAKVVVTNDGSVFAAITKLQGRGTGVYDLTPITKTTTSTQSYGEREITINLPYEDDENIGQGLADLVDNQYATLANRVSSVRFQANTSDALMTAALSVEPGDKVTLTEAVSGLSSVDVFVQKVNLELSAGNWLECEWEVAPDVEGTYWILGSAAAHALGTDTILGYA